MFQCITKTSLLKRGLLCGMQEHAGDSLGGSQSKRPVSTDSHSLPAGGGRVVTKGKAKLKPPGGRASDSTRISAAGTRLPGVCHGKGWLLAFIDSTALQLPILQEGLTSLGYMSSHVGLSPQTMPNREGKGSCLKRIA